MGNETSVWGDRTNESEPELCGAFVVQKIIRSKTGLFIRSVEWVIRLPKSLSLV